MLQVCLNGARTAREHHHLPILPEDLANAAASSTATGAGDIHLHPKTADGTDSLDPHTVAAALRAVRAAAPGTPIGITTRTWTEPEPHDRITAIRHWTNLPDHASVHWHEPGADGIARALHERGIGIEAVIASGTNAAEHFHRSPLRDNVHRIRAEVTDLSAHGATNTASALLAELRPTSTPILLHGRAAGAWPVLAVATHHGLDTRIGLQDTPQLPDGQIATDNAELVAAAQHHPAAHARQPRGNAT